MKKLLFITLMALLLPVLASASDYNYITQDAMRSKLDAKAQVAIVDICPIDQFAQGHLPGSIETNAYPVKTDEERAKLDNAVPALKASGDNIVIVCPGGRGGAKRTYDYYKAQGIDENRLFILEKGMNDWPYQTAIN
ncbi:MAG: rhodanese-like domain-containing protein [Pseudodesulfovibrio sp.]